MNFLAVAFISLGTYGGFIPFMLYLSGAGFDFRSLTLSRS